MNSFSISQLAQFSGIKAHTIRIWEQRYNALEPHRSEGNTRYYDSLQLRRLLNIVSLMKTDHKISRLCKMSDQELFDLQKEYYDSAVEDNDYEYFISQLISAGMNYDELNFDKIFSHCHLRFGLKKTYEEILYPMVNRVGLLWTSNTIPPSQEHYITNLLRQKLFTAIDSLPLGTEEADTWILFLPEEEFHEIGLLFANYMIRAGGKKVIYLGPNVPLSSVENTISDYPVRNLLLFLVHRDLPENVDKYLLSLKEISKDRNLFIAGNMESAEALTEKEGVKWLFSVKDLEKELNPQALEASE
ncbi:MerR family transcriptional regulator [Salinimicrobium soli]|uniref:MerR family transcriptional regulator n=1 Tax=Salinimicrobium soli TaxID=1254399 RepID=UPI003AADDE6F